jgi:hypothetical protein
MDPANILLSAFLLTIQDYDSKISCKNDVVIVEVLTRRDGKKCKLSRWGILKQTSRQRVARGNALMRTRRTRPAASAGTLDRASVVEWESLFSSSS